MKATTISDVKRGYAWGITSGMSWGVNTVLIGLIMSTTTFSTSAVFLMSGALVCSFLHDGFAALWMSLLLIMKKRISYLLPKLKTKDGLFCVLGALLGGPVGMSFYMLAIENAGPAYTATITSSYPALGVALAFIFLHEKLPMRSWLGLLICILGVIGAGYEPSGAFAVSSTFFIGILYAVISALGWALESVVCAYGMKSGDVDPEMALAIRELSSFVVYASFIIPTFCKGYSGVVEVMGSTSVIWLLLTALVGVFSYLAWYKAIDTIGASRGVSFNITYSFWAIVFSWIMGNGEFSLKLLGCCLLIIVGVSLAVGRPKDVLL